MYITWLSIASTVSVRSQSLRMKCMIENLGAPGSLHIIQKRVKYLYILMVSQVVMKLRNYMHQLL